MIHAMSPGSTPEKTTGSAALSPLDNTLSTPPTIRMSPERRPLAPVMPQHLPAPSDMIQLPYESGGNILKTSFISDSSDQPECQTLHAEAFPSHNFMNSSWNSNDCSACPENPPTDEK